MTEGNIANWRVKEGASFNAGDVILEIETDKATMDVEAQDDGMLFKITQGDGSKGVKVGDRIAVVAEEGDDLISLEMPAEASKSTNAGQSAKEDSHPPREEPSGAAPSAKSNEDTAQSGPFEKPVAETPPRAPGKTQKLAYPHFPSVQQLLHENGVSDEVAGKIPASGPSGRLLKGDVLGYLGRINKDYPAQASARLEKLSHLDLSNIQIAKPPPEARSTEAGSRRP